MEKLRLLRQKILIRKDRYIYYILSNISKRLKKLSMFLNSKSFEAADRSWQRLCDYILISRKEIGELV